MSNRKLMMEIDRTLKKVYEGIEIFEAIYEKITSIGNVAQKDKFEGDLKKEIKKLQRYRDQIKTWAASNDIKDKTSLLDGRKAIEQQMEKFKALEKELKTKTYSQAGLNAASRVDPEEEAREEIRNWISEQTDALATQIDALEAEQESLTLSAKKSKRSSVSQNQDRLSKISSIIEKHKFHQNQLEVVLRMIDNGKIKPGQVDEIKDDVQYYVDCNQDDDFEENEYIYEDLDLEEAEIFGFGNDEDHDTTPKTPPSEEKQEEIRKSKIEKETPARTTTSSTTPRKSVAKPAKEEPVIKTEKAKSKIAQNPPKPAPTPRPAGPVPVDPPPPPATLRYASAAASATTKSENPVESQIQTSPQAEIANIKGKLAESTTSPTPVTTSRQSPTDLPPGLSPGLVSALTDNEIISKPKLVLEPIDRSLKLDILGEFCPDLVNSYKKIKTSGKRQDTEYLSNMLAVSFQNIPDEFDSSKSKSYTPTNPYPVPGYYPQSPLSIFTTAPAIFERFDLDTLFFAFYYRRGTYQQYLAARELKRQSWRYHKKYQTWFQRHEEPTEANNEYEQGTYLYFDYERSWTQKQKNDFRFDYKYLEDDLV